MTLRIHDALRRRVGALVREPLAHFVTLGAALFLIWPLIAGRVAPPANQIMISQGQMQRAFEIFYKTHFREPTAQERLDLGEREARTEIYFREGIALGLDRDDEIIRRRIEQKLEFMTRDIADQTEPSDAELQRYLDAHHDDFGAEAQFAFSQIYMNPQRHGAAIASDAALLLLRLNRGDGRLDYGVDSDVLPVPNDFEATSQRVVANIFGKEFARQVANQLPGKWIGPIASGYGSHLVLVRERHPGSTPQLARIRDSVLRDWQAARRAAANQESYQRMRAKYQVSIDMPAGDPTVSARLDPAQAQ